MTTGARIASCLLANVLLVAATVIFAIGFFPHKVFLPGLATWHKGVFERTSAPFDKVIFMVVDALRSDFVYGEASSFAFTQSLIRAGAALPFTGHASAPTITMPRIKAITTGSVPSFLDVVLNFAESDTSSTLASQDTWLAQMKAKKTGNLVMYGDDTWLKLFPGFFDRSDGTTSFFVSDFTEVDSNVTRHIPEELERDDWSVMVMHFLGLDHIGHKTGPRGPNMPAKQMEMDEVVRQIYEAMETSPHLHSSLLVLLGDHGMNDGGNHGGSSAGEVSTALLFVSPKFKSAFEGLQSPIPNAESFRYYQEVEQSDIAPTLAALLGFPIPRNNLGIAIPRMLELWTKDSDRFEILYENALQMHEIVLASFSDALLYIGVESKCGEDSLNDVEKLSCEWLSVEQAATRLHTGNANPHEALTSVLAYLCLAQGVLSGTASNYDLSKMHAGIGLVCLATLLSLFACYSKLLYSTFEGTAFFLLAVAYCGTMFASSYVEEEQQFWYWAVGGWLVISGCKAGRLAAWSSTIQSIAIASVAILFCVASRWNQTGQKHAGAPDLVSQVFSRHTWLLWLLVLTTYAIISRNLSSYAWKWTESRQLALSSVIVCIIALAFKVAFTAADAPELLEGIPALPQLLELTSKFSLVGLARAVFLGIAHLLASAVYYEAPWKSWTHRMNFVEIFHSLLSLFLITQTRTENIPIFLIFLTQSAMLRRESMFGTIGIAVTSIMFQYSAFFMLGGTNSISSIDLSNAYNGIGGYNVVSVAILTFINNWAGPIWWVSAMCCMRTKSLRQEEAGGSGQFAFLTLFTTLNTLAVMLACTLLREHLFVWTVFSPKYLYSISWIVAQHILVNGVFSALLLGRL